MTTFIECPKCKKKMYLHDHIDITTNKSDDYITILGYNITITILCSCGYNFSHNIKYGE